MFSEETFALPFDSYPSAEQELLKPIWLGSNCRHQYGLEYMLLTRQHCCAYCKVDLIAQYDAWLTMVLDHVIPQSVCLKLGINPTWTWSLANAVLSCGA
jgi:5-methylcytosine-specific restriction endonuclease McrA